MVLFGRFACCVGMVLIISDVLISVRAFTCDNCWVADPCDCGQKCCLTWNTYCKNGYDQKRPKDEKCGFPCYSCGKWPDLVEGEDGDDAPGGGGTLRAVGRKLQPAVENVTMKKKQSSWVTSKVLACAPVLRSPPLPPKPPQPPQLPRLPHQLLLQP